MADMRRRQLLAFVPLLSLAGCSRLLEGPVVTATTPDDDGSMSPSEFRHFLSTEFTIQQFRRLDKERINVEYKTEASSRPALGDEIELFVGTYADYVKDHNEARRLNVEITNPFEDGVEKFHVKAEWVRQYNGGQLRRDAVLENVASTVGSY